MPLDANPVINCWLGRAAAEYHSAARAAWVGHQLVLIGARPALVRRALRVASDELTHAHLAMLVARDAGFDGELRLDRMLLTSAVPVPSPSVENALIPHVISEFCVAETVAARLFAAAIAATRQPSAAQALRKFVADEVRHREFAWLCLAWLLRGRDGARHLAQACLDAWAEQIGMRTLATDDGTADLESQQWGLLSPQRHAEVYAKALALDVIPAFGQLGLRLVLPAELSLA